MVSSNSKADMGQGSRLVLRKLRKKPVKVKISRSPTQVTMAPVSIGNTVRGIKSRVTASGENATITGRDFCFTPIGTASVQTWTLVGGTPLTPAAFVDSTLRQYLQMYNRFRFKKFTAHYITSSPTTANGDVMFYYNKNRESPFLNQTSANLLPYVISDPNTVLGPQWQNHSATFNCSNEWKSTDYGITAAVDLYADGDIFLLSKTSTTDSPGYVMFDYTIEFKEKSVIPRLLTLPITKAQWTNVALNTGIVSANGTVYSLGVTGAINISGTSSANPTGIADGDIFKVIIDKTNSTGTGTSTGIYNSAIVNQTGLTTIALSDGTTIYAVYSSSTDAYRFYVTLVNAIGGDRNLQATATGTNVGNMQTWMSYVSSIGNPITQPNF